MRLVRETGKPVAQVARDLGVNEGTLGNWVALERRRGMARAASWMRASGPGWRGCAARSPSCGCGVTCSSEAWPCAGCDGQQVAVAAFIASQRQAHGIPQAVSCRALGVSQSWFYKWKDGKLQPRAARPERLKAGIAALFAAREGKDGSPRITAALREAGWRVSENTVAGLMRQMGLAAAPAGRDTSARPGRARAGGGRPAWPGVTSRPLGSTASGTATAPRSSPARGSCTYQRAGHGIAPDPRARARSPSRRGAGLRGAGHGGRRPRRQGSWRPLPQRPGQRVHLGPVPAGLRAARHPPVHGQAGLGAGQGVEFILHLLVLLRWELVW